MQKIKRDHGPALTWSNAISTLRTTVSSGLPDDQPEYFGTTFQIVLAPIRCLMRSGCFIHRCRKVTNLERHETDMSGN